MSYVSLKKISLTNNHYLKGASNVAYILKYTLGPRSAKISLYIYIYIYIHIYIYIYSKTSL